MLSNTKFLKLKFYLKMLKRIRKNFKKNKQINDIGFEATAITQSISSSASNKGDLGWINAPLSKKFSDQVIKLKIDEVSEPIYTQNSIVFKINK